jgi:hypothetical protein
VTSFERETAFKRYQRTRRVNNASNVIPYKDGCRRRTTVFFASVLTYVLIRMTHKQLNLVPLFLRLLTSSYEHELKMTALDPMLWNGILSSMFRGKSTVEPGYNEIGLYNTSPLTSDILRYPLIPHFMLGISLWYWNNILLWWWHFLYRI